MKVDMLDYIKIITFRGSRKLQSYPQSLNQSFRVLKVSHLSVVIELIVLAGLHS